MSALDTASESKKPGDRIRCVVVTPERTLFDQVVESVALPLFDGELGVLPGRSPLIGRLGYGELRTKESAANHRYFVDGGFAQVRDDVVTVLTNRATPPPPSTSRPPPASWNRPSSARPRPDAEQAEKTKAVDRARAQVRVGTHGR